MVFLVLLRLGIPRIVTRDLRERLMFPHGSPGLLLSCEGTSGVPFSRWGNRASSQVEAEGLGFLSSCDLDLGVPIEFQNSSQASSCVEAWNFTFLSSCERGFRPPVELRGGELRDFS